jgi:ubiquinone/menaquinone biosynthesis C-methylase UbiE
MSGTGWKSRVPHSVRIIGSAVRQACNRRDYDSTRYWKQRASREGQSSVMWNNACYNDMYRTRQRRILSEYVQNLNAGDRILDIGCGIGVVAKMLVDLHPQVRVDAVDFPEMVEVAQRESAVDRVRYIASSAEDYRDESQQYALVVSSGCYSAIRDLTAMQRAVTNMADMTAEGDRVLMIDPFHRCNLLARARFGSRDIRQLMHDLDFETIEKTGVLFWPYRLWLANCDYPDEKVQRCFEAGERWRRWMGPHFWADYKVLGFQKNTRTSLIADAVRPDEVAA